MNTSEEKWPRPADVTDDMTDGAVRRVWYVNNDKSCTHVQVWMPDKEIEMFFSAKGCVDVTRYFNGDTPDAQSQAAETQTVHVCDVQDFAAALLRGLDHAKDTWHKI